jgi:hypothetical protein
MEKQELKLFNVLTNNIHSVRGHHSAEKLRDVKSSIFKGLVYAWPKADRPLLMLLIMVILLVLTTSVFRTAQTRNLRMRDGEPSPLAPALC